MLAAERFGYSISIQGIYLLVSLVPSSDADKARQCLWLLAQLHHINICLAHTRVAAAQPLTRAFGSCAVHT